jgi:hypothetical protein
MRLRQGSALCSERQNVFFAKGRHGGCRPAPYYTDNLMHILQAERFYKAHMVNGMMASVEVLS